MADQDDEIQALSGRPGSVDRVRKQSDLMDFLNKRIAARLAKRKARAKAEDVVSDLDI